MTLITLVIARFNEDLYWILKLPEHVRVIVYNKGDEIAEARVRDRIDKLIARKNIGRESETYLEHARNPDEKPTKWTAFVQGDPFPHSPDFFKVLERHDQWSDFQPLTVRYLLEQDVPPSELIDYDRREYLGDAKVRSELFCLTTLEPLTFFDEGAQWIAKNYRDGHTLSKSANLVENFFEVAGWEAMRRNAKESEFGRFVYGAMFAVRSESVGSIPPDVLERLLVLARGHNAYGFMFERLWLHLFGLSFYKLKI